MSMELHTLILQGLPQQDTCYLITYPSLTELLWRYIPYHE